MATFYKVFKYRPGIGPRQVAVYQFPDQAERHAEKIANGYVVASSYAEQRPQFRGFGLLRGLVRGLRGLFGAAPDDYGMQHRPAGEEGAPLYDLTDNGVYPDDVYRRPDWYAYGPTDWESFHVASRVRGRPDARVWMYRAVPCDVREINNGDWVTTSRDYAIQHGRHGTDPSQDMCVLSKRVPAACLRTDGNSLSEWGYNCEPVQARVSFRPRRPRK